MKERTARSNCTPIHQSPKHSHPPSTFTQHVHSIRTRRRAVRGIHPLDHFLPRRTGDFLGQTPHFRGLVGLPLARARPEGHANDILTHHLAAFTKDGTRRSITIVTRHLFLHLLLRRASGHPRVARRHSEFFVLDSRCARSLGTAAASFASHLFTLNDGRKSRGS